MNPVLVQFTVVVLHRPSSAATRIRSRKEAGADPVALTKHSDEESAENQSFTSDEEDHQPGDRSPSVGPEERRLSTAPDNICTRLVIRVDLYTIPDADIPFDGAHGSVVPATLTNALHEHVED